MTKTELEKWMEPLCIAGPVEKLLIDTWNRAYEVGYDEGERGNGATWDCVLMEFTPLPDDFDVTPTNVAGHIAWCHKEMNALAERVAR